MNISGPRASSSPGVPGATSAQRLGVDDAELGARRSAGRRSSRRARASSPSAAGRERRVFGRAVRALAPAVERGRALRAPSPARRPRRRARTGARDERSVAANAGWSIIVRMNTGVLIITAMRSRSQQLERAARLPHVHEHRGDRARDRQQHAVGEARDVRDGHRQQQRFARRACRARRRSCRPRRAATGACARRPWGPTVVPDVQRIDGGIVDATRPRGPAPAAVGERRRRRAPRARRRRTRVARRARDSRCRGTSCGTTMSARARLRGG